MKLLKSRAALEIGEEQGSHGLKVGEGQKEGCTEVDATQNQQVTEGVGDKQCQG